MGETTSISVKQNKKNHNITKSHTRGIHRPHWVSLLSLRFVSLFFSAHEGREIFHGSHRLLVTPSHPASIFFNRASMNLWILEFWYSRLTARQLSPAGCYFFCFVNSSSGAFPLENSGGKKKKKCHWRGIELTSGKKSKLNARVSTHYHRPRATTAVVTGK